MYPTYHAWGAMPFMHGAAFLFVAPVLIVALLWSFLTKGFALWYAARNRQTAWFIILLFVNTLGILELVYIFGFRADRHTNPIFNHSKPATPPSSSSAA